MEQTEAATLRRKPDLPVGILEDTHYLVVRKAFRIAFIMQVILPFLLTHIITVSTVCISCQPKVSAGVFFDVIYKPAVQFRNPVKIVGLLIITQQAE